jgi:hypothetical protein
MVGRGGKGCEHGLREGMITEVEIPVALEPTAEDWLMIFYSMIASQGRGQGVYQQCSLEVGWAGGSHV